VPGQELTDPLCAARCADRPSGRRIPEEKIDLHIVVTRLHALRPGNRDNVLPGLRSRPSLHRAQDADHPEGEGLAADLRQQRRLAGLQAGN
jgi:hypothetical protein